jgi:hypothetical protein
MPRRKPTDTTHISLRIRESLRRELAKEAAKHRVSLNNEIVQRLNDSFEDLDSRRHLTVIINELALFWASLASDIVASRLELEVTNAVLHDKDPKEIVPLLLKWLGQRQVTRRAGEATEAIRAAGRAAGVMS